MYGILNKYFVLVCLLLPLVGMAQTSFRISGRVTDKLSGTKIEMVTIQIKELSTWTASNADGDFNFEKIPLGNYTLQATCLGFEPFEAAISVTRDISDYELMLSQMSLGLKEVVIVAKENTSMGSSSKIESTALGHVQPNSLADVMQLVPGQISINPNLSGNNQIAIRNINRPLNPDGNSTMGTAIIIDGSPVNNDANMQTLNTAGLGTVQSYSTAGQGVDLRQIATDNIESVEVIRGVPSVEYGELTTGAVIVRTKAGKSKLNVKMKADPNIKQTTFSKGFLVPGGDNGAINIDFDYTNAYDDLRLPTRSYNRLTGQLGYSNTYFKNSNPLNFNAKISYFSTIDDSKNDPDMLTREIYQSKEQNVGVKFFGNWLAKLPWLTSLTYNISGDFKKQAYYENTVVSSGGATPLPTSMVSGESVGTLLPSSYDSQLNIEGKPYSFFATLKGNLYGKNGSRGSNLMYGIEWRTTGNNGEGQIYDPTRPPFGASSTRQRSFRDVPANKNLALFVEEKLNFTIGTTQLKLQAGVRYNNMLPSGLFSTKGFKSLEPRLNMAYNIFQKSSERSLRELTLRFGYGETSKTPPMIFLYPDKYYHDEIGFNYYPDLLVITTKVVDGVSNPDLKPITNTKLETGVDFDLLGVKVILTGFKEKIQNGFSWEDQFYAMDYKVWNPLSGAGKSPTYSNGEIYYKESGVTKQLPYTMAREFAKYSFPKNSYNIDKQGIEYVLNFGRLKSLRSSFTVDGAYYSIRRNSQALPFGEQIQMSYQGQRFPFLPIYPGGKGDILQRFNSNLRIITHIPELKIVTSLTAQVVWLDKAVNNWEDGGGQPAYFSKGESNLKQYGVTAGADKIFVDPIGYYDKAMLFHPWESNMTFNTPTSYMVKEFMSSNFNTLSYPVACQINLKLTKEIGQWARLSFFANNLFNSRPLFKDPRNDYYQRRNESAYFGAEIKFTL